MQKQLKEGKKVRTRKGELAFVSQFCLFSFITVNSERFQEASVNGRMQQTPFESMKIVCLVECCSSDVNQLYPLQLVLCVFRARKKSAIRGHGDKK